MARVTCVSEIAFAVDAIVVGRLLGVGEGTVSDRGVDMVRIVCCLVEDTALAGVGAVDELAAVVQAPDCCRLRVGGRQIVGQQHVDASFAFEVILRDGRTGESSGHHE